MNTIVFQCYNLLLGYKITKNKRLDAVMEFEGYYRMKKFLLG